MLPVPEALSIVLSKCKYCISFFWGFSFSSLYSLLFIILFFFSLSPSRSLKPKTIKAEDSLGLRLAEDVVAAAPFPPFRASIKDGYAVHSSDGPGNFSPSSLLFLSLLPLPLLLEHFEYFE